MNTEYFEFNSRTKLLCGKNALENIPYELKLLNVKKPLILSDAFLLKSGIVTLLFNAFEDKVDTEALFTDIPSDSGLDTVKACAAAFREKGCDGFVALGGGSVIDTAKGANLVASLGKTDLMDVIGFNNIFLETFPLLVIPTTSGTGSEATTISVIKDREKNQKLELQSEKLLPDVAVLDPRLTLSLPKKLTVTTAVDALVHAVEAYTCIQKNPISDLYAEGAIKLIFNSLETAVRDGSDAAARLDLALAANLAGTAFSNSMVGIVHQIGHALGGVASVPHGEAMLILLPHCLKFNKAFIADRYASLAKLLTTEAVCADQAVTILTDFVQKMASLGNVPVTLSEAGVKKEQFHDIAVAALKDGASLTNPVTAEYDEIMMILNEAF